MGPRVPRVLPQLVEGARRDAPAPADEAAAPTPAEEEKEEATPESSTERPSPTEAEIAAEVPSPERVPCADDDDDAAMLPQARVSEVTPATPIAAALAVKEDGPEAEGTQASAPAPPSHPAPSPQRGGFCFGSCIAAK